MVAAIHYRVSQTQSGDESHSLHRPSAASRHLIQEALAYGIETLDCDDEHPPSIPLPLLSDARSAARRGVGVELLVRRYVTAYSAFRDFILSTASCTSNLERGSLYDLLRYEDSVFDLLLANITTAYESEARQLARSSNQRKVDRVIRLLKGEALDSSKLAYDVRLNHLGLILVGVESAGLVRELASDLDRTLLAVSPERSTVWAWLGGRDEANIDTVKRLFSTKQWQGATISIGASEAGLPGWRTTHRQAKACLAVALYVDGPFCYSDKPLLAATLHNELHATYLQRSFLQPLEQTRDGGARLRKTLREYFRAERNISACAERLKVSRRTIHSRLNLAEDLLGRPLNACGAEIETALDLYFLLHSSRPPEPANATT